MRNVKYILFVLLVGGMLIPALQKYFQLFDTKPLQGDFVLAEEPTLSTKGWINGSFQTQFDSYLEQHIGFRPLLVRLNNQIDFSLFRKANAEGVIIGKDDFLFEYDYIRAFTGKDFIGEKIIAEKMNRLKFLQEYLKDSLDIDLVLVLEPGKASFFPEYIPDRFLSKKEPKTNYKSLQEKALENGVKFIDLNQYFLQLKSESKYPLFPKYGTHWSIYGMSFAADTLLKTIEQIRNIELLEVKHDSLLITSHPMKTDDDVEKPMNLLFSLPPLEMAYPVFEFETDSTAAKPMVLAVADSYYWNLFNTRIPKNVFANEEFWYFNAKVFPDSYFEAKYVRDLDLQKEIEKQDVIFLMVTERFMYKFDWNFIDELYQLYTPTDIRSPVYEEATTMLRDENLFVGLINKSLINDRSLEDLLWIEAKYKLRKKDKLVYLQQFGATYFEDVIKADEKWTASIAVKAEKKKIQFEEMLDLDANYLFKKQYPELYRNFQQRKYFEEKIRNDSRLLKQAKSLSLYYHCPLDRAIRHQAGIMADLKQ